MDKQYINDAIEIFEENDVKKKLKKIYESIPSGQCNGCGNCCNESVHTYFSEFMNIVSNINEDFILKEVLFKKAIEYGKNEWTKVQMCPFLSEEKKCLIYESRPLVCRMFGHLSEKDHETQYLQILEDNLDIQKAIENNYGIILSEEIVQKKIDYCKAFKTDQHVLKEERGLIQEKLLALDFLYFEEGFIDEEDLNRGLIDWFIEWSGEEDSVFEQKVKRAKESR